jgi:hypothetical protein
LYVDGSLSQDRIVTILVCSFRVKEKNQFSSVQAYTRVKLAGHLRFFSKPSNDLPVVFDSSELGVLDSA